MKSFGICLVIGLALIGANEARAQLMFDTTFDKYEHPKSDWDRWSSTKVGDYIEYSDGKKVFARFEAIKVGDHEMTIRTITHDELSSRPSQRDIKHVFDQADRSFGKPTSVTDDELKLNDSAFATRREEFQSFDKQPIKQVWYSDAAPFDGMLKYQQYVQGKPSAERIAAKFRKGDKVFGKE